MKNKKYYLKSGSRENIPELLNDNPLEWVTQEFSRNPDGATVGEMYNNVKQWLNNEPNKQVIAINEIRNLAKIQVENILENTNETEARNYVNNIGQKSQILKMQLQLHLNSIIVRQRQNTENATENSSNENINSICENERDKCCIDTTENGDGSEVIFEDLLTRDEQAFYIKADGGNFCRSIKTITPQIIQRHLVRICQAIRQYTPENNYLNENIASQLSEIYVNARLFGSMNGVMFPIIDLFGYIFNPDLFNENSNIRKRTFEIVRDEPIQEKYVIGYLASANFRPGDPLTNDAYNDYENINNLVYQTRNPSFTKKLLIEEEEDVLISMSLVSAQHCEEDDKLFLGRLRPIDEEYRLDDNVLLENSVNNIERNNILYIKPLDHLPQINDINIRASILCNVYKNLLKVLELMPENGKTIVENVLKIPRNNTVEVRATRFNSISRQENLIPNTVSAGLWNKLNSIYMSSGQDLDQFFINFASEYKCSQTINSNNHINNEIKRIVCSVYNDMTEEERNYMTYNINENLYTFNDEDFYFYPYIMSAISDYNIDNDYIYAQIINSWNDANNNNCNINNVGGSKKKLNNKVKKTKNKKLNNKVKKTKNKKLNNKVKKTKNKKTKNKKLNNKKTKNKTKSIK